MTQDPRGWLPRGLTTGEGVRAAISTAVAGWSEDWFARPAARLSMLRPVDDNPAAARVGWLQAGSAVAINLPRRNASRLVGWALDIKLELQEQTEADQRLLEILERGLIADLVTRIETSLGIDPAGGPAAPEPVADFGRDGGVMMTLSDANDGDLLQLALPQAALLPFCRTLAPPARKGRGGLEPRAGALGRTSVTIEANLGRAQLTLDDLRNLAPGDVLVLSAGLNDPINLSLAGSGEVLATARLTDVDGGIALTLQA